MDALLAILKDEGLENEFEQRISLYIAPFSKSEIHTKIPGSARVDIKYDIFLSSTKTSLQTKLIRHQFFNEELLQLVESYTNILQSGHLEKFKKELKEKTQLRFFGRTLIDEGNESSLFNEAIEHFRKNLQEKLKLKIAFPRPNRILKKLEITGHPPTEFEEDYSDIISSKGYLIVSPYPQLFTSAWIGLSIAISFGKPILMITNDPKSDVPYIISNEMSHRDFIHKQVNSIKEIPKMYEFVQEKFLPKLV